MIRKPSCNFGNTDVGEIPDTEKMLLNIKRHAGITEAQRLIAFTKLRVEILNQVKNPRPPISE
jgi:hypothetical protein